MLQRERLLEALKRPAASPGHEGERRAPGAQALPPLEKILEGEWQETESGLAFVKETWFERDRAHGKFSIGALLEVAPEGLAILADGASSAHPSELAFFDAETTGLSGGTGTYLFLAGLGSFEGGAFRLRQYFLPDLGSERAMLEAFLRDLSRFHCLVTYNGRAFDVPLLETRMTLARLRDSPLERHHIDLLHAVRRLYRHRLPSCRLADAERHLLGVERDGDVPGHLIPSSYFDYVRAGRASQLKAVFRHNAADILSIAGCLAFLGAFFTRPDLEGSDALLLARWWDMKADAQRAEAGYRAALPRVEGSPDWAWGASRLAALLKRSGSLADAVELWRRLWEMGDRPAGLELLKHLEHKERKFSAAEDIARSLLASAGEAEKPSIEHRLARLQRKMAARKKALALRPAPCPTT